MLAAGGAHELQGVGLMSRTFKDRKWTLKMRDSGEFVPRERVYGRRVSAAEVASAVGEVERDSEVARLEAAGFEVEVRVLVARRLVGYRWVDRSGNMWDTTKGENEGLVGFELARARGSVVGFERVFSLPVFEVVGVKDVSAPEVSEGSENESWDGVSACGPCVGGECALGVSSFGDPVCGGECVLSECAGADACAACPASGDSAAGGDVELTVGEAARLLGGAAVRAARERGGELRAAYDVLSDPDFVSGLDWRTLQDRETGRVRRNIRWERAGSRRRVEPTREPVPSGSWDGVEARAAVRRVRHEAARTLASLARAVNGGGDLLDDERM